MSSRTRLILTLAIVVGILWLWTSFFPQNRKNPEQPPAQPAASAPAPEGGQAQIGKPEAPPKPEGTPQPETTQPQPEPAQPQPPAPAEPETPAEEKDITVKTNYLVAVFSSKGGALKSLEILPTDGQQYGIKIIDFDGEAQGRYSLLVNTWIPGDPTKENVYHIRYVSDSRIEFQTFWGQGADRMSLIKTFDFSRRDGDSPYSFRVTLKFLTTKTTPTSFHFSLTGSAGIKKSDPLSPLIEGHIAIVTGANSTDHLSYDVGKVFDSPAYSAGKPIRFVAVTDKYFAVALVPVSLADVAGSAALLPVKSAQDGGIRDEKKNSIIPSLSYDTTLVESRQAAPGFAGASECEFLFYAGPRQENTLKAVPIKYGLMLLEKKPWGADYGIGPIAKAILALMKGIDSIVGNYGLAIIILTVIVRLILFPLSKKQQLSMQKMQKLAPKLKAIREKFKGNRQKQNEETVKLYKQYGVNPAAGCLPLVIQLPVFFGLFGALSYAIELRKQPFLYITDLSVADGLSMQFLKTDITVPLIGFNIQYLNILPIVMIIVWVLQQALAPRAVDPQQRSQQKMMMVMPVIFGLLLYNYAAGLSIYMICNMFLGMVEQAIVKRIVARHIADEEPQPVSQPKGAKQTGRRR